MRYPLHTWLPLLPRKLEKLGLIHAYRVMSICCIGDAGIQSALLRAEIADCRAEAGFHGFTYPDVLTAIEIIVEMCPVSWRYRAIALTQDAVTTPTP